MRFVTRHFKGEHLRARVLQSSTITFATYGIEQGLRLVSNLILTRLLYPEAFGLMALASVILTGLVMLSDLGVDQSIIQNEKGATAKFRNTAWVAQIGRGFILWLFACAIAYPISQLYQEPILLPIVCALGSNLAIKSFSTTSKAVQNKELNIWRLSIVNVSTQAIAIVLTILFAINNPSVWALVWGNILAGIIGVLAGHKFLNDGFKHKIEVDKEILKEIIHFGKWIFLSSAVGFLVNQADKIIVSKMLSLTDLGIYTIAVTFAQVPRAILFSLTHSVLFPIYSKIKTESPSDIQNKVFRSRLLIIVSLLPITLILIMFGNDLVFYLYDERYHDAGWMTQILAAGIAILIATHAGPFYLGFGNPRLFAFTIAIKAFILISSMLVCGLFWGKIGLVFGVCVSELLYYFVEIYFLRQFKLWFWKLDIVLLSAVILISFISININ